LIFLNTFGIAEIYYVYYNSLVPVYKSLYEIEPFFDYTKVVEVQWKRPNARLEEIRRGTDESPPVILVHGIDPNEIVGEWTNYKKYFVESWKRYLPEKYGLYIYIYPSLDVPLEETAHNLVEEVLRLSHEQFGTERKFNFYAHSMGGLLLRYALQDKEFVKHVNKIIFAATPHIGSPFADIITINKRILSLRKDWDFIKSVLLGANIAGVFIQAPNYKYLVYGSTHSEIPNEVDFVNFAEILERRFDVVVSNIAHTKPLSATGLLILNALSAMIFLEGDFTVNDGMVPLVSATAIGKSEVFKSFDHSDFILGDIIINRAIELFYNNVASN